MVIYQSLYHKTLDPITNIISTILETVLVCMHQLEQLKPAIELLATERYTYKTVFPKS